MAQDVSSPFLPAPKFCLAFCPWAGQLQAPRLHEGEVRYRKPPPSKLEQTWRGRLGKWGIAKLLGKERGRQGICKLREGHVTAGTRLRPGENVPSTSGQGAWHIGSKPYNFRQKRCQLTVNRPRCRGTDVHGQLVLSIPMEWCTYCTCMWWMMKKKRLISVIQWHAKNHLVLALSLGTMFKMQYNCPTAEFGVFSKTWW